MTSLRNKFATVETVLASAVADDGTFTVSYPTGTTQLSYNSGLDASGSYMIVNGNDKWSVADPGISISYDASLITITNLTGASLAAGSTILLQLEQEDGKFRIPIAVPINLASITGSQDVVTEIRPGIEGYIEAVEWVQNIPVTTAAKLATLNLEIDTTNLTGGTVALTSAACTPMGARIAGAAITANNRLTRDSKLSVEASGVTAFAEGSGTLMIYVRPDGQDQY